MPILKNSRHEKFAQLVANGYSATEAYNRSNYSTENADVLGPKLLGNVRVAERIGELKEKNSAKCELSREEAMAFLTRVVRTAAGAVNKHDDLCQEYEDMPEKQKIKIPDKLGAIDRIAKMCGWNEPDKVELGASNELTELLKKLRGSG